MPVPPTVPVPVRGPRVPELPEVEVVRRGLARWLVGRRVAEVEVLHPRPVRRHAAGPDDFAARLRGRGVVDVVRRGKFLWAELDDDHALLAHLGMSGQMLLVPAGAGRERHLRVRASLEPVDDPRPGGAERDGAAGRELRFVDQRMFGGLSLVETEPTPDGLAGGSGGLSADPADVGPPSAPRLPVGVGHVARDVLDPLLDVDALVTRLRAKRTTVKRALLDQGLVSGIGNIYADEALWRARVNGERATSSLPRSLVVELVGHAAAVMREALAVGGTSFDSLYVDVNGSSGRHGRRLAVYGQTGRPCPRCGTPIVREAFANRSSHRCPRCQPDPRA